ncbi:hypothetical protein TRFO_02181 [Tritrichomonas foetus]|uniref:Uncharacterized protein n=1 Tax=Tritrichomonas foetus TaxID=1144522 RepID=A0A1J4J7M2_9EUKA|nr:hypothetical protein TRFO_02181 [Tritrichomonas foetus]|eukprot:OHS95218.1 hypothetical protein TRFO_02181 [Tritrichomonas foetus]
MKKSPAPEKKPCQCPSQLKTYAATFCGGFTSGVAGEILVLVQDGKLSVGSLASPAFSDACVISGIQQVCKDYSKNTMKQTATFAKLSKENPLVFGACTGFPMWALTRVFATPIQNSRKKDAKPYDNFVSSIFNDVGYHTCKNGIDEYFNQRVFPKLLPQLPNFPAQKAVEAAIAGAIGAGCYVIAWPYKTALTGQTFGQAVQLMNKNFPKVALKKLTYTLVRPEYGKLLK